MLLSGCKDGQVAISNPHTGVILHMINEHKGIPISDLSVAKRPLQVNHHCHHCHGDIIAMTVT